MFRGMLLVDTYCFLLFSGADKGETIRQSKLEKQQQPKTKTNNKKQQTTKTKKPTKKKNRIIRPRA